MGTGGGRDRTTRLLLGASILLIGMDFELTAYAGAAIGLIPPGGA